MCTLPPRPLAAATVIAPVFAKELLGNGTYTGTTVLACAQAEWGGALPGGSLITAFTISACEWYAATTNGTVFAQPPPYPPSTLPSSTLDRQIKLRATGTGTGCTGHPAPDGRGQQVRLGRGNGRLLAEQHHRHHLWRQQQRFVLFSELQHAAVRRRAEQVADLHPGLHLGHRQWLHRRVQPAGDRCLRRDRLQHSGQLLHPLHGLAERPRNSCSGTTYCIDGYFVRADYTGSGTFGPANLGLYAINLTG